MSKSKTAQVLLSIDEYALVTEAAARTGISVSSQGRLLFLAWVGSAANLRGSARGGSCSTCGSDTGADWYNNVTKKFCCETCAKKVNGEYQTICTLNGGEGRLTDTQVEQLQARLLTREDLVTAMLKAAAAVIDFDNKKNSNDLGLFSNT